MEKTFERVKCKDLKVDMSYQRDLDPAWLRKIVKGFDETQIRLLTLSRRNDGSLYIINGNHTRTAALAVIGKDAELEAEIYHGLSEEQEASLFNQMNTNSKRISYNDSLKAKYAMGDPDIVNYIYALNNSKLNWNFGRGSGGVKVFTAHRAGIKAFHVYGNDIFTKACMAMGMALDPRMCNGKMIGGICYILSRTNIDESEIGKVLHKITQDEFENEIKIYKSSVLYNGNTGIGKDYIYAKAFLDFYNKGKKQNKRVYIDPPIVEKEDL